MSKNIYSTLVGIIGLTETTPEVILYSGKVDQSGA
jgi:hypothetical protein